MKQFKEHFSKHKKTYITDCCIVAITTAVALVFCQIGYKRGLQETVHNTRNMMIERLEPDIFAIVDQAMVA